MDGVNSYTYTQVDRLLSDANEYRPLEFLLHQGRINYCDYEAWRAGEIEFLDEFVFGDREQILLELQSAREYMEKLGWQMTPLDYTLQARQGYSDHLPERAQPRDKLCFSENHQLNELFHARYCKPEDDAQLDLFFDNGATIKQNELLTALLQQRYADARELLETLYDQYPEHAQLGDLECLLTAAEGSNSAFSDDVEQAIGYLIDVLIPIAERLMGAEYCHFIVVQWRRISDMLMDSGFDPQRARCHLSFTASQSQDWQLVCDSIERQGDWRTHSVLLLRHAHAKERMRAQQQALLDWSLICWQYPELACEIENAHDAEIKRAWIAFTDVEPELPNELFPAWLLLQHPLWGNRLPDSKHILSETGYQAPQHMDAVRQLAELDTALLAQRDVQHGEKLISARADLQQHAPELFQYFLNSRSAD